jgi:hypothetical protein
MNIIHQVILIAVASCFSIYLFERQLKNKLHKTAQHAAHPIGYKGSESLGSIRDNMGTKRLLKKTILGVCLGVLSVYGLGEEDTLYTSEWEFRLKPAPHLSKYGNVTHGNRFIIQVDGKCGGGMAAWFASYNKKQLFQAKGKMLPVQFSVSLFSHTEIIQEESEVNWVDDMVMDGMELPFAVSSLDVGRLNDIDQLRPLGVYQMTTFDITAADDQIYDVPRESWDFNGFLPALNKAVSWCESRERINLQYDTSGISYYVSL